MFLKNIFIKLLFIFLSLFCFVIVPIQANESTPVYKSSIKYENEENLKKLHSLIMNNKGILKSRYIKISKKQEKKTSLFNSKNSSYKRTMTLAVYLNYQNVLEQIENNQNLADLGELVYGWEGARAMYRILSYNEDIEKISNWGGDGATIKNFGYQAIQDCKKKALKRKLKGGKCMFVDLRKFTGSENYPPEYINYLLVNFKDREQDFLTKEKKKIEKIKKEEQEKLTAEKKRKEEEKRKLEQERLAAEEKFKEEKRKLEQERLAAEQKLTEEKQKLEEEKRKLEEEKLALQKELEDVKKKTAEELEQNKKTPAQTKKEEREKKKKEKLAAQIKAKEEKEKRKKEKLAAQKKAKEEKEKKKKEKLAAQKKAKEEKERLKKEKLEAQIKEKKYYWQGKEVSKKEYDRLYNELNKRTKKNLNNIEENFSHGSNSNTSNKDNPNFTGFLCTFSYKTDYFELGYTNCVYMCNNYVNGVNTRMSNGYYAYPVNKKIWPGQTCPPGRDD